MRKYLFLVLCLVSSVGWAGRILCPESITCEGHNGITTCVAASAFISGGWYQFDKDMRTMGHDGTYNLSVTQRRWEGQGECIYNMGSIGNVYFMNNRPMWPDTRAAGNKWNETGQGCKSQYPEDCPYSDEKPKIIVDG